MCSTDIFLGVLALIFPPLPVWVKTGICSCDSLINILLCMLGFLPGLLHAWYIIAKFPEPSWEYEAVPDSESGYPSSSHRNNPSTGGGERVTYVFIREDGRPCHHPTSPGQQQQQQNYQSMPSPSQAASPRPQPQQQGYGTVSRAEGGQESGVVAGPSRPGPSSGSAPVPDGVPPSYAEAVGDHKIQSRE